MLDPLIRNLESWRRPDVACEVLGRLKATQAVDSLVALLERTPKDDRYAILYTTTLAMIGGERAVDALVAALADRWAFGSRRWEVYDALARVDAGRAREILTNDLDEMQSTGLSPDQDAGAALALARLGERRALPILLQHLDAVLGQWDSRYEDVCDALERVGERELADSFRGARKGEPRACADLARRIIEGDPHVTKVVLAWKHSKSAQEAVLRAVELQLDRSLCETHLMRPRKIERDPAAAVWEPLVLRWRELHSPDPRQEALLRYTESQLGESFREKRVRGVGARGSAGAVWVNDPKARWFECPICAQPDRLATGIRKVIAVLAEGWDQDTSKSDGELRINWLKRDALFDFDAVEIVRARDYDVQRLLIAVGNDTDEWRRPRYRRMPCSVACGLSENTLRNLRSTFGEVSVQVGNAEARMCE
ncbi:MAG: hypothetical protein M1570_02905 [Chloroflexi bacterium]|nr:hypothetical protein [Chloroflexota bacterium]